MLQSRSLCFHGTFECTIATMDAYSRTEQQVPPHLMKADLVKLAEHIETTNQLRTLLQVCSPALHVFCNLPSFERCFPCQVSSLSEVVPKYHEEKQKLLAEIELLRSLLSKSHPGVPEVTGRP